MSVLRPVRADDYDPPLTAAEMVACPDEFVIDDEPFRESECSTCGGLADDARPCPACGFGRFGPLDTR